MDLFRNGLIPDPFWGTNEQHLQWIEEKDWIYQTEFDLQISDCEHIELVAKHNHWRQRLTLPNTVKERQLRAQRLFINYVE